MKLLQLDNGKLSKKSKSFGKLASGKRALGKTTVWVKWHWVKWNWINCHVAANLKNQFPMLGNYKIGSINW